jgi:hypothetical protein
MYFAESEVFEVTRALEMRHGVQAASSPYSCLPLCARADCTYCCLNFPEMKCIAVEFQPKDTSKVMPEPDDQGVCWIQRRRDGRVSVAQLPGRCVS